MHVEVGQDEEPNTNAAENKEHGSFLENDDLEFEWYQWYQRRLVFSQVMWHGDAETEP